jgi:hypothetical protein
MRALRPLDEVEKPLLLIALILFMLSFALAALAKYLGQ